MRVRCAVVVGWLVLAAVAAMAGGGASAQAEASTDAVEVRDRLIAEQESLLNAYRCMFDIDTQLVPEGCPAIGQATQPAPQSAYIAVAAGMRHSCAIATDGRIKCWGRNYWGQTDPPEGTYTAISAGESHSCAIATDGTIECWGDSDSGQTDAPEGTYTAIAVGHYHSCAIATDGTFKCWGGNRWGQTGQPAEGPD